ncbi:MAG: sulfatase-like hydrolase/transferase, partial [Planctomycetota bacterium]
MAGIRRRDFLKTRSLGAAGRALPACAGKGEPAAERAEGGVLPVAAAAEKKPNFVVIFTDDQGYQDIGCFGSPNIRTPNLDRMAAEGRRFTDFYVASPVCSPSRAALLTGCYPPRVGITGVLFPRNKNGLNPDEITIADLLKGEGYATACIGKWHLGHKEKFLPRKHGFDLYYGIPYSNDMTIAQDMKLAADLVLRGGMTRQSMWKAKKNLVPLMRNEEVIE